MNNIIPMTVARGKLSNLASLAVAGKYFVLTKGGSPKVALVDVNYLRQLEDTVRKVTQKTYIDPRLDKYSREFSEAEIKEWQNEDEL